MKRVQFGRAALAAVMGLAAAASVAPSAMAESEVVARVRETTAGGRQFEVTDRQGLRRRVVRPARPPQAAEIEAGLLREGDLVRLRGIDHGNWFEASRVEVLSGTRLGGATPPERVLRFTGFAGERVLRAIGADGAEYRIVLPLKPQMAPIFKDGGHVEPSALHEGDRIVARGVEEDHTIRADRVELLDESRLGRGAAVPLRLTYRGSGGWRRLIAEAADGTRYEVLLPRRPQALYFVRDGSLVEPSALQPGDTIEVRGVVRGDTIDASRIIIR